VRPYPVADRTRETARGCAGRARAVTPRHHRRIADRAEVRWSASGVQYVPSIVTPENDDRALSSIRSSAPPHPIAA
jgi:hypothetical protein